MKSEKVTEVWEYCRDNYSGFKEPMRKQFRRLDEYVSELESKLAELRERIAELDELLPENGRWFSFETVEAYVAEIAKLRELVRHMYECMGNIDADGNYECYSCEYDNEEGGCDFEHLMRELGIEVDDECWTSHPQHNQGA